MPSYMGRKKGFRLCVYCCWEILRFVSDSFFFLPYSLVNFFLLGKAVKKLRTEKEKDQDTFKPNFYFRGLRLFCGVECFLNQ